MLTYKCPRTILRTIPRTISLTIPRTIHRTIHRTIPRTRRIRSSAVCSLRRRGQLACPEEKSTGYGTGRHCQDLSC